jgi:hypothetical protein
MSLLFAATYPDRTSALVLWGGMARMTWAPDYPIGASLEDRQRLLETDLALFGPEEEAEQAARTYGATDSAHAREIADYFRRSASPGAVRDLWAMNNEIDVRHVLPSIRVPTLVAHAEDDGVVPPEFGRYVTDHVPGARFVSFPGGHVLSRGALTDFAGEVERFLDNVQKAGRDEQDAERVLSTVLFTDIVGSTAKAVELGDTRWRELRDAHHEIIRRQLTRFRGRELDTAGDGFFASFDGPARAIRRMRDLRRSSLTWDRGPRRPAHRRMRADGREGRWNRGAHRRTRRGRGGARGGARLEHRAGSRRRFGYRVQRA